MKRFRVGVVSQTIFVHVDEDELQWRSLVVFTSTDSFLILEENADTI